MVAAHRRIIHRGYTNVDEAGRGAAIAIADGDHKAVTAVVVGVRGIGKLTRCRVKHDSAVSRLTRDAISQGIAIDISCSHLAVDRRIFRCCQVLVAAHRGIVNRIHTNPHCAGRSPTVAIADGHDKTIATVKVGVGGVHKPTGCRIKGYSAAGWLAGYNIGQGIAFDILCDHLTIHRRVFIGGEVDVIGGRRVIHWRDRQTDCGSRGITATVGHCDDKTVTAVVVGIGGEDKLAGSSIQHHSAINRCASQGEGERIAFQVRGANLTGNGFILITR